MAVRSVRVKRDLVIAKIDEHIKAILDKYATQVAEFEKYEQEYPTLLATYEADLAAHLRRLADAVDGTSKEKVIDKSAFWNGLILDTAKGKRVQAPQPPAKPLKPTSPDQDYWTKETLDHLRSQKALLEASEDEVISVGANDYGVLFTTTPGDLNRNNF